MQRLAFAIGRPNPTQKKKERKKVKSNQQGRITPKPTWTLLPSHAAQGYLLWMEILHGNSFFSKRADLLHSMESIQKMPTSPWTFPKSTENSFQEYYLEKAKIVLSLLHKNQELRWKFKRFFTIARIQRFRQCNDHDPITLERIDEPISVPIFSLQKIYVFEAKSFAKLVHTQLLTNDGQIPTPVYPKNPLTNEPFPMAQLLSLLYQCRSLGHTSWILESFSQCRCDIARLLLLQSKPLRLHALRNTMSDPKSWDFIDTLYDFIKTQHFTNNIPFQKNTYRWAVNHATSAPRMETWRRLCTKWYEVEILYDDPDTREEKQEGMSSDILAVSDFPQDLKDLHLQSLK